MARRLGNRPDAMAGPLMPSEVGCSRPRAAYDLALIDLGDTSAGWVEGFVRQTDHAELDGPLDRYEAIDTGPYRRALATSRNGRQVYVYESRTAAASGGPRPDFAVACPLAIGSFVTYCPVVKETAMATKKNRATERGLDAGRQQRAGDRRLPGRAGSRSGAT